MRDGNVLKVSSVGCMFKCILHSEAKLKNTVWSNSPVVTMVCFDHALYFYRFAFESMSVNTEGKCETMLCPKAILKTDAEFTDVITCFENKKGMQQMFLQLPCINMYNQNKLEYNGLPQR